jgi:ferritin-like metal-binding protein YciE
MTSANTPLELFFDQMRDIHSMELQLCDSLPHLASLCTDGNLKDLISKHAHHTCSQIEVIAAIFARHGESPGEDKSKAIAGLIEGGTAHLEAVESPHTRDLMMVAHCLRVEYYEMASYEITILLSGQLGLLREPTILSELVAEEKEMANALMEIEPNLFEIANSGESRKTFQPFLDPLSDGL